MFIQLLKLEVALGFDTDKGTFQVQADEKVGPLPDATQRIDIDVLKAAGVLSGGLKKDVLGLLGHVNGQ